MPPRQTAAARRRAKARREAYAKKKKATAAAKPATKISRADKTAARIKKIASRSHTSGDPGPSDSDLAFLKGVQAKRKALNAPVPRGKTMSTGQRGPSGVYEMKKKPAAKKKASPKRRRTSAIRRSKGR